MSLTKYSKLSIILIGVLMTSCLGKEPTNTPSLVTPESTQVQTTRPELTTTPISLPTETKSAPTALHLIQTDCISYPDDAQKLDLNGIIAFEQPRTEKSLETSFYLLNLENRNVVTTVPEGIFKQISPDRKHLAYKYDSSDGKNHLRVLDSSGKTNSDFLFRIDGIVQSFFNWQTAEQLRTLQQENDSKVTVHLLNPFTQEHTVLRTDWEGVYKPTNPFYDKLVQWKFDERLTEVSYVYGANILYDPSLTRVFYPKAVRMVALVDVENGTELASTQFVEWGRLPSWSPDGQYLTIVNHEGNVDEIYLISRDGNEFQKITNFSGEFDLASIFDYAWSPDSKRIALWLNTETGEQEYGAQSELAILDVENRQITRLCIQGLSNYAAKPWQMNHPEPMWSPDGKYVMITQWGDAASPRDYNVLVIDPEAKAIEKISENTAPIGWMSSEP